MREIVALVTSAGAAPAYSVIRGLKEEGAPPVKVIAVDMDELAAGFYFADRHYVLPPATSDTFMEKVIAVCRDEKVEVIFPILEDELMLFADAREEFAKSGVKLFMNPRPVLEMCFNKTALYRFCLENEITMPVSYTCRELKEDPRAARFPLLAKLGKGRRRNEPRLIKDADRLQAVLESEEAPAFFFQEFVEGREYTVEVLTGPDGRVVSVVPRVRLSAKAGICVKAEFVKDGKLIDETRRIVKKLNALSPLNLQFIKNGERCFLIDVNPKFPGGGGLTVKAGVNIPKLLLKQFVGIPISEEELDYQSGSVVIRYWEDIKVTKESIK